NLDASKITSGEIPMPRIAPLAAAKVTSGTFDSDRIPNLNANKITAGTLSVNRLPVGTTSGTVAAGNHTHFITAIFPYTHRVGTTDLSLRVGPDYTHAVIGTLTQSDAVAITTAAPQAGGGDTWRYVWPAKLGFGWLPWLGVTSISEDAMPLPGDTLIKRYTLVDAVGAPITTASLTMSVRDPLRGPLTVPAAPPLGVA